MKNNNRGSLVVGVSVVLALVSLVVSLGLYFSRPPLGAAPGPEHTEQQFFYDGFAVGSQASPTQTDRIQCGTSVFNLASIGPGATASVDIAVTGATSSQNQAYFGGVNTSTLGALPNFHILSVTPSSTSDNVTMMVGVTTGTTAVNLGTSTFSACYIQF